MIDSAKKTYFAKGEDVVNKNVEAIIRGANSAQKIEIPESWGGLENALQRLTIQDLLL